MASLEAPQRAEELSAVYALLERVLARERGGSPFERELAGLLRRAYAADHAGVALTCLPLLVCQALGGNAAQATPAAAAWRACHLAAKLLDDVQDGDNPALEGAPSQRAHALNLAVAFFAAANLALAELEQRHATTIAAEFSRVILRMAHGQEQELGNGSQDLLESGLEAIQLKSGTFFGLGAWAGARCATDDQERASAWQLFGHNLGMLIQLGDDLLELQRPDQSRALRLGRLPLAARYALVAADQERAALKQLLEAARDHQEAEAQAWQLVARLGGEAFLLAELLRYRRRASRQLEQLELDGAALGPLRQWLANLVSL